MFQRSRRSTTESVNSIKPNGKEGNSEDGKEQTDSQSDGNNDSSDAMNKLQGLIANLKNLGVNNPNNTAAAAASIN